MPTEIQPRTGTFKTTSVARAAGPSILRQNVPEARWPPRPRLSVETTDVPSTAPTAQRSTWSLGLVAGGAAACIVVSTRAIWFAPLALTLTVMPGTGEPDAQLT